jgi:hypothetical protein
MTYISGNQLIRSNGETCLDMQGGVVVNESLSVEAGR